MDEITHIINDSKLLDTKKLAQIITFLGDGRLKDNDNTFRNFLKKVSNDLLVKYAEECLEKSFQDSGLALQDIVNEIGSRLGFLVTPGIYRGNRYEIGFDGIWKQYDEWSLVIEVKTTDAYRISLDTISQYREHLITSNNISESKSSILIVVGRDDTGELEAQIRGSKHAWDIRLISIDSLIKLLHIKESLSDENTAQKVSIALRPFEYTRVDQLIDLLFKAIKDVEVEVKVDENVDYTDDVTSSSDNEKKFTPVNFHEPIYELIKKTLGNNFIKQTKSSYSSTDSEIGIVISISKQHPPYNSHFDSRYWFAFHPHQNNFLLKYRKAYVCYGCGDEKHSFLLPFDYLEPKLNFMWQTKNADREYKHIVIYHNNEGYFLRTNIDGNEHYDNIDEYLL